ncbi:hypothetical protein BKG69_23290 [Mycobacteroides chelonae]|uniref:WXG100 family type VII secretion target n=1 Tax=Mycobacteroides TaxID=670516 RepID=UPI0008A99A6B|nr:WXG100 family type VII secretion target [Mycobacteroides chelonae]AYM40720.1 hypothetical protein DYE20_03340 [[Mycobacterium] chelonae subsp. gwanakae]OHT77316.1 hypothetical protein BKG69_23290 [Mycobacteroides chelonae]OHU16296.1 hypothetical protein BKG75_14970 [Mycobacteroides chelonae]GLE55292.1 hypothetical protein NJBCHELONAE_06030 [Mycobacteroides chelonae]
MSTGSNLEVSYDVAVQKVGQAEEILTQVKQTVKNWQDTSADMISSSWQGHSSGKFGNQVDEQGSEFNRLIAKLDETMSYARESLTHFQTADQEN